MKAGKIKMLIAILCVIVCIVAIFATIASASGSIVTDAEMAAIKNAFGDYLVQDTRRVEDDGYVGAVQYTAYYDKAKGNVTPGIGGTPTILYVINTNTERVGTLSDIEIIQSMLDRGYVVVVVDYLDNVKATGHKLDDSAQVAAQNVRYGRWLDKVAPLSTEKNGNYHETFVCPAGHDVLLNQVFWEIDKHSADGTLEKIVENWNTDFKGTKAERLVKWAAGDTVDTRKKVANDKDGNAPVWYNASGAIDANGVYTKVKFTVAETITDCVNPDGSPLAMDMLLNLVYPTNPKNEVPVLTVSSCWGYPTNTNQCYTDLCSHHTGALFRGYAGAIYDYLWHPMARDDSFGYYDGNLNTTGAVTGDHMNYSIHLYNDKLINTAAIRYLRYLSIADSASNTNEKYNFDLDAFVTIGLSKGAWFSFLGEEVLQSPLVNVNSYDSISDAETAIDLALAEFTARRIFDGHHGETRFQAGNTDVITGGVYTGDYAILGGEKQPWLTYGGEEIISGVQITYAANGSQQEDISKGHSPIFAAAHMNDEYNAAYGSANEIQNIAKSLDIPLVFFEVDQLHEYAFYPDMFYGVETYDAFFDFANYYLKNAPVKVLYTDPSANEGDVSLTDKITVQFSGAVTLSEVSKITVTAGGTALVGSWESVYGGTQWIFSPENLNGNTTYRVTVPATLSGDNGVAMGTEYVSEFTTEAAIDSTVNAANGKYYTFTAPTVLPEGMDSFIFRFAISNNAANIANLYAVESASATTGELIGSVNLKGAGAYEIDVTEFLMRNAGNEVTLMLEASKTAGTFTTERELSSFDNVKRESYTDSALVYLDADGNEATSGTAAIKVSIKSNAGRYGGGDAFYENVAPALGLLNVLGTSKITKADYGRQVEFTFRVYDTVSRTLQVKLNSMTSSSLGIMDYGRPMHNITTKAGEWITVTVPYVVYDTDYGTTSNVTKSIFISISPSGDTNMPAYFADLSVTETVTDMTVSGASITAKSLGKAEYKAPSSSSAFAVYNGDTLVGEYTDWKAAFAAYKSGYTLKLNSNYTITNSNLFDGFGNFASVVVDLNGYKLYSANTSNAIIWAKSTSVSVAKTAIVFKNGGITLSDRPLVSYENSTTAGAGKQFDITLSNIKISLAEQAMATELITASSVANGAKISANITLDECDIDLGDEDKRATVMLVLLPEGNDNIAISYNVIGGSIRASHPRWITLLENSTSAGYEEGVGGYTKLYLPSAYKPVAKVSFITDGGYASYESTATSAGVTEYALVRGAGSTMYGVIPDEYLDEEKYPFVVFRDGAFIGAYSTWYNATSSAQNSVNSDKYLDTSANIVLRRDYKNQGDVGAVINSATNIVFDLSGNTFICDNVGIDLTAIYNEAPYKTTVTVKNGTVQVTRGIAFLDIQSRANQLAAKPFEVYFNDVTFGFPSDANTSWSNDYLITMWDNNAPGTNVKTVFNDCIFNLKDNLPTDISASDKLTVFNVANSHAKVDIEINGGGFVTGDVSAVNLYVSDSSDTMTVGKGSDGKYPTLTVHGNYAPISNNFVTAEGDNLSFSLVGTTNGVSSYELKENELVTKYGTIGADYADKEAYPYAIFRDGVFITGAATWRDATTIAQNAVGSIDYINSTAVILLRRDHGNYNKDTGAIINNATNIIVDLDGHTFTNDYVGIDISGNYSAAPYKSTIKIINGKILITVGLSFVDVQHASGQTTEKLFDLTYENVELGFAQGAVTGWSNTLTFTMWGAPGGAGTRVNAKFNNCVFNLRDNVPQNVTESNRFNLFTVADSNASAKVNITVNGGEIIADNMNLYNVYSGDSNDSIIWGEGNDGYTKLTYPSANTPVTDIYPAADGDRYFVEVSESSAVSTYVLTSLKTSGGTIPHSTVTAHPEYLSAIDYPIFAFLNGALKFVEKATTDSERWGWQMALAHAKDQPAGSTYTIVLRRDYNTKGNDLTADFIHKIKANVIIDLAGYTFNCDQFYMLDAYTNDANFTNAVNITVKNGRVETTWGNSIMDFNHGNSQTVTKQYNFTFDKVTFKDNSGKVDYILLACWDNGNSGGINANLTLNDCIFDFTGAKSGATMIHTGNSKTLTKINVKVNGGKIIADDFVNYSIAKIGNEDSLVFGKGSDGEYTKLTQKSISKIPTVSYKNASGDNLTFGDRVIDGEYSTYTLSNPVETKYGWISSAYSNASEYPFALFTKDKAFIGGYTDFGSAINAAMANGVAGNYVILARRDSVNKTNGSVSNITGSVIVDLAGYTIENATNYMFDIWNDNNVGRSTGIITINNGTIKKTSGITLLCTNGGSGLTKNAKFTYVFNDITFVSTVKNDSVILHTWANSSASSADLVADVTFNNCIFDFKNSVDGVQFMTVTNPSTMRTVFNVTVNGGSILAKSASNMDKFIYMDEMDTITFTKSEGENYTTFILPSGAECPTVKYDGKVFVKISDDGEYATYRLRPESLANVDFVPKMSLTLDRDLILNVYVPVKDFLNSFTLDGKAESEYDVKTVTLDGGDYYRISIALSAKEAARNIELASNLTVDGKNATATFNFGIIKYAEKILADGTNIEKALVCDVLSYVRAAYAHFETVDAEAIARIDEILGENYDENNAPAIEGSATAATNGLKGATFVLDGTPAMRFYLADGADASSYKFYIGGVEVNTVSGTNSTGAYVDIDAYAYAVCETVTYTVNGTESGSFHIRAYYEWAKTQNDAELENLVARFWKYCQSARDYKASVVTE